jgi:hypothetical protein
VIDTGAIIPKGIVAMVIDYEAFTGVVNDMSLSPTISYSTDNVTWTAISAVNYSGSFTNARYFKYVLNVTSSQLSEAKINAIDLVINLPRITDQGSNSVSVAATGKTVSFAATFVQVESITVTPTGTSFKSVSVDFNYATANPTTFDVYLYDDTGAKTTGSFAWTARGV